MRTSLLLPTAGVFPPEETNSFIGVRAYHSTTQSIGYGAWNTVALDSETFDTDSMHDASTNNQRLTFNTSGRYSVVGYSGAFDGNSAGIRKCGLFWNGGGTAIAAMATPAPANETASLFACAVVEAAVNDYVDMKVYQTASTALNISEPFLAAIREGA